jgi:hypothetical protein
VRFTWRNIPGWFDFYDLYAEVAATCEPRARLVEVGVAFGRSAAFMAQQIAFTDIHLYAVDSFAWHDETYIQEFTKLEEKNPVYFGPAIELEQMLRNPKTFVQDNLWRCCAMNTTLVPLPGSQFAIAQNDESLDFVFIDAAHTYEDTVELLRAFLPKVKRGCMLAGHDHLPEFPGVVQAVAEVLGKVEQRRSSFVWVKP